MSSSLFWEALSRLYCCLPRSGRRTLLPFLEAVFSGFRRMAMILSQLRLTVFFLQGREKSGGREISVLVLGAENSWPYLAGLVFSDLEKKVTLGRVFIWNVGSCLRSLESRSDLVFLHVDEFLCRALKRQGFLPIPEWVSFQFSLSRPIEQMLTLSKSKTLRENLRRIRKHKFTSVETREPDQFEDFYRKMYLPYVPRRYGETTRLVGFPMMKLFFESGTLLLVREKDDDISGSIIMTRKKSAKAMILGLKEGNIESRKKGAVAASYYFTIQWAKENGFEWVDFGECRPFFNDGLFYFKKSWGMTLRTYNHLRNVFGLKTGKLNPAAQDFLSDNPLIAMKQKKLIGFVLAGKDHPLSVKEVESILQACLVPGLDRLVIISAGGADPQAEKMLRNRQNQSVEVIRGGVETPFSKYSEITGH